jgi:uncharacterized membrane protein YeiH
MSGLVTLMEAVGLFACAMSGFIEARKKNLDVVSTFIVGFASAFGGGTLRDVLLDRRPFYWIAHENYAIVVFGLALIAPYVIKIFSKLVNEYIFIAFDAIGLGLFTISGASLALSFGIPPFSAALLGVLSAVFGGLIRDIMLNQIPSVLRDSTPYASCAFIGALCYVIITLSMFSKYINGFTALIITSSLIFILRMLAWYFKIKLPQ